MPADNRGCTNKLATPAVRGMTADLYGRLETLQAPGAQRSTIRTGMFKGGP